MNRFLTVFALVVLTACGNNENRPIPPNVEYRMLRIHLAFQLRGYYPAFFIDGARLHVVSEKYPQRRDLHICNVSSQVQAITECTWDEDVPVVNDVSEVWIEGFREGVVSKDPVKDLHVMRPLLEEPRTYTVYGGTLTWSAAYISIWHPDRPAAQHPTSH